MDALDELQSIEQRVEEITKSDATFDAWADNYGDEFPEEKRYLSSRRARQINFESIERNLSLADMTLSDSE